MHEGASVGGFRRLIFCCQLVALFLAPPHLPLELSDLSLEVLKEELLTEAGAAGEDPVPLATPVDLGLGFGFCCCYLARVVSLGVLALLTGCLGTAGGRRERQRGMRGGEGKMCERSDEEHIELNINIELNIMEAQRVAGISRL